MSIIRVLNGTKFTIPMISGKVFVNLRAQLRLNGGSWITLGAWFHSGDGNCQWTRVSGKDRYNIGISLAKLGSYAAVFSSTSSSYNKGYAARTDIVELRFVTSGTQSTSFGYPDGAEVPLTLTAVGGVPDTTRNITINQPTDGSGVIVVTIDGKTYTNSTVVADGTKFTAKFNHATDYSGGVLNVTRGTASSDITIYLATKPVYTKTYTYTGDEYKQQVLKWEEGLGYGLFVIVGHNGKFYINLRSGNIVEPGSIPNDKWHQLDGTYVEGNTYWAGAIARGSATSDNIIWVNKFNANRVGLAYYGRYIGRTECVWGNYYTQRHCALIDLACEVETWDILVTGCDIGVYSYEDGCLVGSAEADDAPFYVSNSPVKYNGLESAIDKNINANYASLAPVNSSLLTLDTLVCGMTSGRIGTIIVATNKNFCAVPLTFIGSTKELTCKGVYDGTAEPIKMDNISIVTCTTSNAGAGYVCAIGGYSKATNKPFEVGDAVTFADGETDSTSETGVLWAKREKTCPDETFPYLANPFYGFRARNIEGKDVYDVGIIPIGMMIYSDDTKHFYLSLANNKRSAGLSSSLYLDLGADVQGWVPNAPYYTNDIVVYNGAIYMTMADSQGVEPPHKSADFAEIRNDAYYTRLDMPFPRQYLFNCYAPRIPSGCIIDTPPLTSSGNFTAQGMHDDILYSGYLNFTGLHTTRSIKVFAPQVPTKDNYYSLPSEMSSITYTFKPNPSSLADIKNYNIFTAHHLNSIKYLTLSAAYKQMYQDAGFYLHNMLATTDTSGKITSILDLNSQFRVRYTKMPVLGVSISYLLTGHDVPDDAYYHKAKSINGSSLFLDPLSNHVVNTGKSGVDIIPTSTASYVGSNSIIKYHSASDGAVTPCGFRLTAFDNHLVHYPDYASGRSLIADTFITPNKASLTWRNKTSAVDGKLCYVDVYYVLEDDPTRFTNFATFLKDHCIFIGKFDICNGIAVQVTGVTPPPKQAYGVQISKDKTKFVVGGNPSKVVVATNDGVLGTDTIGKSDPVAEVVDEKFVYKDKDKFEKYATELDVYIDVTVDTIVNKYDCIEGYLYGDIYVFKLDPTRVYNAGEYVLVGSPYDYIYFIYRVDVSGVWTEDNGTKVGVGVQEQIGWYYSSTQDYKKGNLIIYDGFLYRALAPLAKGFSNFKDTTKVQEVGILDAKGIPYVYADIFATTYVPSGYIMKDGVMYKTGVATVPPTYEDGCNIRVQISDLTLDTMGQSGILQSPGTDGQCLVTGSKLHYDGLIYELPDDFCPKPDGTWDGLEDFLKNEATEVGFTDVNNHTGLVTSEEPVYVYVDDGCCYPYIYKSPNVIYYVYRYDISASADTNNFILYGDLTTEYKQFQYVSYDNYLYRMKVDGKLNTTNAEAVAYYVNNTWVYLNNVATTATSGTPIGEYIGARYYFYYPLGARDYDGTGTSVYYDEGDYIIKDGVYYEVTAKMTTFDPTKVKEVGWVNNNKHIVKRSRASIDKNYIESAIVVNNAIFWYYPLIDRYLPNTYLKYGTGLYKVLEEFATFDKLKTRQIGCVYNKMHFLYYDLHEFEYYKECTLIQHNDGLYYVLNTIKDFNLTNLYEVGIIVNRDWWVLYQKALTEIYGTTTPGCIDPSSLPDSETIIERPTGELYKGTEEIGGKTNCYYWFYYKPGVTYTDEVAIVKDENVYISVSGDLKDLDEDDLNFKECGVTINTKVELIGKRTAEFSEDGTPTTLIDLSAGKFPKSVCSFFFEKGYRFIYDGKIYEVVIPFTGTASLDFSKLNLVGTIQNGKEVLYFEPHTYYPEGVLLEYSGIVYRVTRAFTSGAFFLSDYTVIERIGAMYKESLAKFFRENTEYEKCDKIIKDGWLYVAEKDFTSSSTLHPGQVIIIERLPNSATIPEGFDNLKPAEFSSGWLDEGKAPLQPLGPDGGTHSVTHYACEEDFEFFDKLNKPFGGVVNTGSIVAKGTTTLKIKTTDTKSKMWTVPSSVSKILLWGYWPTLTSYDVVIAVDPMKNYYFDVVDTGSGWQYKINDVPVLTTPKYIKNDVEFPAYINLSWSPTIYASTATYVIHYNSTVETTIKNKFNYSDNMFHLKATYRYVWDLTTNTFYTYDENDEVVYEKQNVATFEDLPIDLEVLESCNLEIIVNDGFLADYPYLDVELKKIMFDIVAQPLFKAGVNNSYLADRIRPYGATDTDNPTRLFGRLAFLYDDISYPSLSSKTNYVDYTLVFSAHSSSPIDGNDGRDTYSGITRYPFYNINRGVPNNYFYIGGRYTDIGSTLVKKDFNLVKQSYEDILLPRYSLSLYPELQSIQRPDETINNRPVYEPWMLYGINLVYGNNSTDIEDDRISAPLFDLSPLWG